MWAIMFCSSYCGLAHGFSYVRLSTETITFVYDMGLVLVFVLEFEYAINFPSLPQDVERLLVISK